MVNNTNLCKQRNSASSCLDGQNGKTADSTPKVAVKCPKAHKHTRSTTASTSATTSDTGAITGAR